MRSLQGLIEGKKGRENKGGRLVYPTLVNYDQTMDGMIKTMNEMIKVCDVLVRHNLQFPVVGVGIEEVDITLFDFDHPLDDREIWMMMAEDGHRPAKIEELLAFGAQHPSVVLPSYVMEGGLELWVVALGSLAIGGVASFGDPRAPFLIYRNISDHKGLELDSTSIRGRGYLNAGGIQKYRFAAVSK
jgi:hypothetical protein